MIAQKATKLNLHIVVLTVLAILLVPEVAWAQVGLQILFRYFLLYPLCFLLSVGITILFIKAFEVPLSNSACFFIVIIEYIFMFIGFQIGLHISLFDVFAPYYYLAFYCSASLVYMMLAWPFYIILIKKISSYRHLKALFLAALGLIFFSIILMVLPPAS